MPRSVALSHNHALYLDVYSAAILVCCFLFIDLSVFCIFFFVWLKIHSPLQYAFVYLFKIKQTCSLNTIWLHFIKVPTVGWRLAAHSMSWLWVAVAFKSWLWSVGWLGSWKLQLRRPLGEETKDAKKTWHKFQINWTLSADAIKLFWDSFSGT